MSISVAFAIIWVAFTVASALLFIPVLVWAVKSGQFADKDHARYLPLLSDGPKADPPNRAGQGGGDVLP
jgi:nitrogen fixation-related uncharacterized protein